MWLEVKAYGEKRKKQEWESKLDQAVEGPEQQAGLGERRISGVPCIVESQPLNNEWV